MTTQIASIDKTAALTAKVASMTEDQKRARIEHLRYASSRAESAEDSDLEFSILVENSTLKESLSAKVAAMTPAQRVERREQLVDAAPSYAGDHEFCLLMPYDENGESL